jgi:transposase-like protein
MNRGVHGARLKFSRAFKTKAVRLVLDRGMVIARAVRDVEFSAALGLPAPSCMIEALR